MLNLLSITARPAHSAMKPAVRTFAYGAGQTDLNGPNLALAARHAT